MRNYPNETSTLELQQKSSRRNAKTKYRKLDLWSDDKNVQKEPTRALRANRSTATEREHRRRSSQQELHQSAIRGTTSRNRLSDDVGHIVEPTPRGERRQKTGGSRSSTQGESLGWPTSVGRNAQDSPSHQGQSESFEASNESPGYLHATSSPCGSSRHCDVPDQDVESCNVNRTEREDRGHSPESEIIPIDCSGEERGGSLSVPEGIPSDESEGSSREPISTKDFQALWANASSHLQAAAMVAGEGNVQEMEVGSPVLEEANHSTTRERHTGTRHRKHRWKKINVAGESSPRSVDTPPRPAVRDSLSESGDQEERYVLVVSKGPSKASTNVTGSCTAAPERPPAAKPCVWSKKDVSSRILSKFGNEVGTPYVKAVHGSTATGSPEYYEAKCGLVCATEQTDAARKRRVVVEKNFTQMEKVEGKKVNVVGGLELYKNILSAAEQETLVRCIEHWLQQGEKGKLLGRTYTAPKKWLKGKGRRTVQFGCCYNYATDNKGRKPGILTEEAVEPMPPILSALSQRLVRWGILPSSKKPDSGIVNVYEEGDCIPPHIDNHDFARPFVTISLVSTAAINFGAKLQVLGPGDFSAAFQIMLPPGSCLVLKGNGADIAQHCIPSVKSRRISITLRRMGDKFKQTIDKCKIAEQHGWTNTSMSFNPV